MNFGLLLPAGLAALGALLLPPLIHLVRRSEQRPTLFAALQWLQPKSKPRHRLRFDEWLLLLVRLLLLALLALLLARPVLFGSGDSQPRVAVVPGVDLQTARAQEVESDASWLWLAPGFPAFNDASRAGGDDSAVSSASDASRAGDDESAVSSASDASASVASLLRELDASLPPATALTVLVPEQLYGVDAQRPILSRRVEWRVLPGAMTFAPVAPSEPRPSLSVRYTPEREGSVRFLRAVDLAWRAPTVAGYTPDVATASQPLHPKVRHLAWLVPGPLPRHVADWVHDGGTVLVDAATTIPGRESESVDGKVARGAQPPATNGQESTRDDSPAMAPLWRDETGTVLVEGRAYGNGRLLRFTRTPMPQDMPQLLEPDFPRQLHRLLLPAPRDPARVRAVDFEPVTGGPAFAAAPRELQSWLVALIALAFFVERWLASGARRGASP